MMIVEEKTSALGHVCMGGGAAINNSPINITLNVSINLGKEPHVKDEKGRLTETGRTLQFLGAILSGVSDRKSRHEFSVADLQERIERVSK